jgi:hypothetical protein
MLVSSSVSSTNVRNHRFLAKAVGNLQQHKARSYFVYSPHAAVGLYIKFLTKWNSVLPPVVTSEVPAFMTRNAFHRSVFSEVFQQKPKMQFE